MTICLAKEDSIMMRKQKLLEMKVNKKLLYQHLTSSTGKVIILNVQTDIHQSSDSNNLETLVQWL